MFFAWCSFFILPDIILSMPKQFWEVQISDDQWIPLPPAVSEELNLVHGSGHTYAVCSMKGISCPSLASFPPAFLLSTTFCGFIKQPVLNFTPPLPPLLCALSKHRPPPVFLKLGCWSLHPSACKVQQWTTIFGWLVKQWRHICIFFW